MTREVHDRGLQPAQLAEHIDRSRGGPCLQCESIAVASPIDLLSYIVLVLVELEPAVVERVRRHHQDPVPLPHGNLGPARFPSFRFRPYAGAVRLLPNVSFISGFMGPSFLDASQRCELLIF
jgi:hypothetical protein